MSECILIVPVEGYMELVIYDTTAEKELRKRDVTNLVRVNLSIDNSSKGSVTYGVDGIANPRATEITGMLTGAYVRVSGVGAFEIEEQTALEIMLKVAV